jgi:hypothetical protein
MTTQPAKQDLRNRVIKGKTVCPGCGHIGDSELWRSHGRVFEDLSYNICRTIYGRIDGGQWHNLGDLNGTWDRNHDNRSL